MSVQFGWFALNTCHCTLGVGEPLANAMKLAVCPTVTVVFAGFNVTDGDCWACKTSNVKLLR